MFRPIDVPAALLRKRRLSDDMVPAEEVITVARGPLIMMAYGMRAVPPGDQASYWIHTAAGDLNAAEAEAALRRWTTSKRPR